MEQATHTRHNGDFNWDGVPVLKYKEEGSHFHKITRQVLYAGDAELPCELRYFEIAAEGYSTLERHQHHHVVMILRGTGEALVNERIVPVALHDVLHITPGTWHQLRANQGTTLGFICLVACERDRPERPDADELARLRHAPAVAAFIRL